MKATYSKQTGNYRITLTRKEAEALAYNFTSYSILLTALKTWKDSGSFTIYGSKAEVGSGLAIAMKGVRK